MLFEDLQLAPPILKALKQCGHTNPTPVQAESIPKVLAGCDLAASARTGTGKTAAFMLPALQRLSVRANSRPRGPRVLVITPTRELADQATHAAQTYGKYLRVRSVAIFGGMPFREQIRALSQSPEMIIATPGRLLDHMDRGRIDLSSVELFVLDEADRMLDMGFIDDVKRIAETVPSESQTLLFAATLSDETTRLAGGLLKNPERVQISPEKITHDAIEQRLYIADDIEHKHRLLQHICADDSVTKAIIFSATKRDADALAQNLTVNGMDAAALHGDMTQSARNRTMMSMRRGRVRLLVATDVAARGIDITGISHVINFDLPRFSEDYVHRIGRTGRAGESGVAISFVSRGDLPYLDKIERYIGQNLTLDVIPGLEPSRPLQRPRKRPYEGGGKRGSFPHSNRPGGGGNGRYGKPGGQRGEGFNGREDRKGFAPSGPKREHHPAAMRRNSDVKVEYRRTGKPDGGGHRNGNGPRSSSEGKRFV